MAAKTKKFYDLKNSTTAIVDSDGRNIVELPRETAIIEFLDTILPIDIYGITESQEASWKVTTIYYNSRKLISQLL